MKLDVDTVLNNPKFSHVLKGTGAYSRAFLVYHFDEQSPTGTKIVASFDLSEIIKPIKQHGITVLLAKDKK